MGRVRLCYSGAWRSLNWWLFFMFASGVFVGAVGIIFIDNAAVKHVLRR